MKGATREGATREGATRERATGEIVKRHATALIPLLKNEYLKFTTDVPAPDSVLESAEQVESRRRRAASFYCDEKLKSLISKDLV